MSRWPQLFLFFSS